MHLVWLQIWAAEHGASSAVWRRVVCAVPHGAWAGLLFDVPPLLHAAEQAISCSGLFNCWQEPVWPANRKCCPVCTFESTADSGAIRMGVALTKKGLEVVLHWLRYRCPGTMYKIAVPQVICSTTAELQQHLNSYNKCLLQQTDLLQLNYLNSCQHVCGSHYKRQLSWNKQSS